MSAASKSPEQNERSQGPIGWAELGLVPDSVIRAAIRRLNRQRLEEIEAADPESSSVAGLLPLDSAEASLRALPDLIRDLPE